MSGEPLTKETRVNEREQESWELLLLDAGLQADESDCLNAGDIDGDGNGEIIVGGKSEHEALVWYRPATREKGVIVADGWYHVGMAIEDIDRDGIKEVVVGEQLPKGSRQWAVVMYKAEKDLRRPWARYVIDSDFEGGPHDIIFADVDGDGQNELLVIACYTSTPGIFIFKKRGDSLASWQKHTVSLGYFTEGLSVGDLDGDGRLEIVCGPDWYKAPADGPYAGPWQRHVYAPNFREMCRTVCVDITGNGRPDILITDSEYMDGALSWFENRLLEDPARPWVEHRLEEDLIYSHALEVERDASNTTLHLYMAEMEQGGWNASYNPKARLIRYSTADRGQSWQRSVLHKGDGVCGGVLYSITPRHLR